MIPLKQVSCHVGDSKAISDQSEKGSIGSLKSRWLTVREAANYVGLGLKRFQNRVSNGHFPFYEDNGRRIFLVSELDQVLGSNPKGVRLYGN
ncbi:MAG: DNA-binding protein [Proteobacteria bacterium]|nr:DNA-binding protein [Pseudomonadota bacterium]NDG26519.1 DNA-binding protein [Pseudomonadota bacterium]